MAVRWFSSRVAFLCLLTITVAVLLGVSAYGQSPCEQIKQACTNAGFVPGGASTGSGLWRDCVDPILQGRAHSRKSGKAVPQVDPKIVAACKAQDPSFGQPKSAAAASPAGPPPPSVPVTPPPALASSAQHPNIVFILTDDLSMNLVQFMPHVLQMQKQRRHLRATTSSPILCAVPRARRSSPAIFPTTRASSRTKARMEATSHSWASVASTARLPRRCGRRAIARR